MRLLVTGDRTWANTLATYHLISAIHAEYPNLVVIHGDAPGADTLADQAAKACGAQRIAVPAKWDELGNYAGIERNQRMLDMQPDSVLAFHTNINKSKGTKDMVIRSLVDQLPVFLCTGKELWQIQIDEKQDVLQMPRLQRIQHLKQQPALILTIWKNRLPVKQTLSSADLPQKK